MANVYFAHLLFEVNNLTSLLKQKLGATMLTTPCCSKEWVRDYLTFGITIYSWYRY
jgi:hypothetical protein